MPSAAGLALLPLSVDLHRSCGGQSKWKTSRSPQFHTRQAVPKAIAPGAHRIWQRTKHSPTPAVVDAGVSVLVSGCPSRLRPGHPSQQTVPPGSAKAPLKSLLPTRRISPGSAQMVQEVHRTKGAPALAQAAVQSVLHRGQRTPHIRPSQPRAQHCHRVPPRYRQAVPAKAQVVLLQNRHFQNPTNAASHPAPPGDCLGSYPSGESHADGLLTKYQSAAASFESSAQAAGNALRSIAAA